MSSQYCKPSGSDPVWRCPVCDQTDGTTIKLGAIETDKTGGTIYSARRYLTQDMYRDTVTLALLRWIAHLEQFSQTNQTKEDA